MLFLSRKEGQSVKIYTKDGVITVYVGQHRNGQTNMIFQPPEMKKPPEGGFFFPDKNQLNDPC